MIMVLGRGWESKYHSYLQEGQEQSSEELPAVWPRLNPSRGDGRNLPGKDFQSHKGQEGDHEWSAWIYKGELMIDQPGGLLQSGD